MELLHLQYFREIARDLNMTRTARRLNISQPALSKTLRNLETELGVPLFDRKGRGIQLNEHGQLLFEAVDRALNILDSAALELQSRGRRENSTVAIADMIPEHAHWFVEEFLRRYETIPLSEVMLTSSQEDAVRTGAVDMLLSFSPTRNPDCRCEQLLEDQLLLIAAPEQMAAIPEPVTLESIYAKPVILHNSGLGISDDILSRFSHPAYQVSDVMMLMRLVEQGYGFALIPSYLWLLMQSKVRFYVSERRMPRVVPLTDRSHGVYLIYSAVRPISRNVSACIQFTRDYFQQERTRIARFHQAGYTEPPANSISQR